MSLRLTKGGTPARKARGERAACGSDEPAAQASGAGREDGRARRGLSFRLTDLLLLAALTFAGLHLLMEPMRAASGLYEVHLARSGLHVTAVCALSVILVTRVGMMAGFALARLFGGKGGASLCATVGCVLCAWSLLYGVGSKGLYECFCWPLCPPKSDLTLTDPAFGDAEPISQSSQRVYRFNGWITPE